MRFDFRQEAYFDNHTHLLYTDVLSVKPDEFAVNYYHGVRDAVNKDGKAVVSDEAKKHLPYQGVIMMLVNAMSQKFGWAIGSAVTGWLLHYFGFRANEVQSAEAIHGIKMFLSFLPAVGTALSVFFISLYPLSERRMRSIMVELENKRAANMKNQ